MRRQGPGDQRISRSTITSAAPDGAGGWRRALHGTIAPAQSRCRRSASDRAVEPGREALGLRGKATAFLCCQHLPKYLPQFDGVFADIARRVGDAQFVFIGSPRGAEITARFRRRLGRAFAAAGLDASRHVVILSPMTTADFMGVARLCDVFLDSIGWSGYNSTLECLACDLPIVTWPGP